MKAPADKTADHGAKAKAEILLRAALTRKAFDPVILKLEAVSTFTDYFVIVSAKSGRQVGAIAQAVLEEAHKHKFEQFSTEGINQGTWALLDYGDVIVHVFHSPVREFYDLEGLWLEAPREPLSEDIQRELAADTETEEWDDF